MIHGAKFEGTIGTLVVKLLFFNSSNLMVSLNVSVHDHEISRSKTLKVIVTSTVYAL